MMRICHLAAGAGNMYCGACVRDAAMARALIAEGHEVQIIPLYTPLRVESGEMPPVAPVHLGAVNAYLQQLSPVFTRLPGPLARLLDHEGLLRWLSRFAVSTKPSELGPMTVSVLAGEDGRQRAEIDQLLCYLEREVRPDAVSITNSLLSGVTPAIKRRLGLPILCEVKGEDGFIEGIPEPYRSRGIELMRRNARFVDRFISPTQGYIARMSDFLQVETERFEVVRSIVDAEAFARSTDRMREPLTIGYVSVITARKGLHVAVEALAHLVREGYDARLRVAGQVLDRKYWREIRRTLRREALTERFEYLGEVDFLAKVDLMRSLSAFCAPAIKPEALGTSALEAMAAGVPVVVPDDGVFPETLALTEGGLLFEPASAESLAAAIARLADDPDAADAMGVAGMHGIAEHFSAASAAAQMERILETLADAADHGEGVPDGEEAL